MNLSLIIDFIVVAFIATNAVWGYKKGLTHLAFKFVVSIASIVIVFLIYKPVINFVFNATTIDEKLSTTIENRFFESNITNENIKDVRADGATKYTTGVINSFLQDAINNAETNVIQYIAVNLAKLIVQVVIILILYLIIRFLLSFLKFIAEAIADLPILHTIDKSGGFIYGLLKGLLVIFVIFAIVSLISPIIESLGIIKLITNSYVGSILYNNNIVLNFLNKIL